MRWIAQSWKCRQLVRVQNDCGQQPQTCMQFMNTDLHQVLLTILCPLVWSPNVHFCSYHHKITVTILIGHWNELYPSKCNAYTTCVHKKPYKVWWSALFVKKIEPAEKKEQPLPRFKCDHSTLHKNSFHVVIVNYWI